MEMSQIQRVLRLVFIVSFVCYACADIITPDEREQFQQDIVEIINNKRAKHNVAPLVLNDDLTAKSQEWADYLLNNGKYEKKPKTSGQNLFLEVSNLENDKSEPKYVVRTWYKEIDSYSFEKVPDINTSHFTQLVWKSTTDVGVGWAASGGYNIVVCFFSPPGNVEGRYLENVIRPA